MSQYDLLIAALNTRARFAVSAPLRILSVLGDLAGFFTNLYNDLIFFSLAMSTFFFAWAALLFGASGTSGNERTRQHAMTSLYAALVGLALAILAGTIASLISGAAIGQ